MPDAISSEMQRFLSEHIRSIAQLELLLLLQHAPEKAWTVAELAKDLYIAAAMTQPLVEQLVAAGLLISVPSASGEACFQYSPKSPALGELVAELAKLYTERRLTVINAIYSNPTKKLQNFADAFRFRQQEED